MRKALAQAALAAAVSVAVSFAADNSLGTWKLNVAKSKYSPGAMPVKALTTTREAWNGGVKVTNTGQRIDDMPIHVSYSAKYDGTVTPVAGSGAPYDRIAIKQVDANTFTDQRLDGGTYHMTGRMVVSNGGRTLTWTSQGTDAGGKPVSSTFVFDKQ